MAAQTPAVSMRGITKRFPGRRRERPCRLRGARRARCTRCSARTAPARRPCRTSSPASTAPDEGDDLPLRRARLVRLAARGDRRRSRHGPPAVPARRAVHRRGEPHARRPARRRPPLPRSIRAPSTPRCASSASATASRVDPRAHDLAALGRRAAARRDPEGALPGGARPHPRRADRGAHPARGRPLFATLRQIAGEGRTVIFISHKLHEVMAVSDRVTVLRAGKALATVQTADATPQSLAIADGRPATPAGDAGGTGGRRSDSAPVLEVEDLWAEGDRGMTAVKGVSLTVRAGEIAAIAGVSGNGQRELAEAITGLRSPTEGLDPRRRDARCGPATRGRRSRPGSATCPRTASAPGVAPSLSIAMNLALSRIRDDSRGPFLQLGAMRANADRGDRDVRDQGAGARPADGLPLGRQPAEGRDRARVLRGPEGARRRRRRRAASTSPPSRGARAPAPGRRERHRRAADQRGPRRDPRAQRPHPRHVRGHAVRDARRVRRVGEIGLRMAGQSAATASPAAS